MTIDQLLQTLAEHEVMLFVKNGGLRYRAPTGALTSDLCGAIAEQRPALVEHLRSLPRSGNQADISKCTYCDPKSWIDAPTKEDRIRTTCGKCGRFIGYRPADL